MVRELPRGLVSRSRWNSTTPEDIRGARGVGSYPPVARRSFLGPGFGRGGKKLVHAGNGLPRRSFDTAYRERMDRDEEDLRAHVGTDTGQFFFSRNAGATLNPIADDLYPILSLNAATA
jgi:hypothetical protein